MTMFTRNDKAPDPVPAPAPGVKPPVRETAPSPMPISAPAPVEARRSPPPGAAAQVNSVSVISKSLKITGQLESTEDIQIEGEVDGDVRAAAVKVGSTAKIRGTVSGEEVELAGTVDGKIEARKVVLTSTAHMNGDVIHQDIRIDSGAFIDGHCRPDFGKPDAKIHAVQKPVSSLRETA